MRICFVAIVMIFYSLPCFAQDSTRLQGKIVFHAPVPVEPGWYPAGWSITNFRDEATDNTNLMLGVGRKLDNGWVEFMAQRQYAFQSNMWFFDFRISRRLHPRLNLFVEVSPFLETMAVYHFARAEYRVGRINLMVESENIHRRGKTPSLGVGPGISVPPMKLAGKLRFAPAVSWQMRPNDPDFVRFYFGFTF